MLRIYALGLIGKLKRKHGIACGFVRLFCVMSKLIYLYKWEDGLLVLTLVRYANRNLQFHYDL